MKLVYRYPALFLNKIGELYWSVGHPVFDSLPEESWNVEADLANRRLSPKEISENEPQLTLVSEFGNIDYIRTGKEGAPVLLLIPGFPDCWFTFHKIIPILAQDFDVISYSPPGHGYSTFTPLFDFKLDTYCRVARMLIHRLQLKDVHLMGHSVGGEQAIRTTLQMKSKGLIRSLTLINAWGPSVYPRKTKWDFTEDVTTWPVVGKELVRLLGGKLGGMKEMFRRVFYQPEERSHVQNICAEISKPFITGTAFKLFVNNHTANAIVGMQREQKQINENVHEYFLETRRKYGYLPDIPVLVIGTKHDRIFSYAYARGLFRSIQQHNPKTYFRKIKASGHMPAIETPTRLAHFIRSFIRTHEPRLTKSLAGSPSLNAWV